MDGSASVNSCAPYLNVNLTSEGFHALKFWMSLENFRQEKWDRFLQSVGGEDPFMLYIVASAILIVSLYTLIGAHYVILDITNKPAFLRRYKVQPGTNEPLDIRRLLNALPLVCFNLIVVSLTLGCGWFWLMEKRGLAPLRQLPTLGRLMTDLTIFTIVEELGMYYSHRLLHSSYLYKRVHKRHHEWTTPVAMTALYCHPFEHMFSNMSPVLFGPLLMASHVTTVWIWLALVMFFILNAHSGYHFPFFPSPELHDFHHQSFTQCYGLLGFMDWLHGTDNIFRKSKSYKRHRTTFGLLSAREMFPGDARDRKPQSCGSKKPAHSFD